MNGIVDVGGGLRGVYGAGVFDRLMEEGVHFPYMIGVSAGSANISSYMAGQKYRNLKFYTEYAFRKNYMSLNRMLFTGSYVDLEYIYGVLSNSSGEYPLDFDAILSSDKTAEIVSTDAVTGKSVYFNMKDQKKNDYGAIKASSCIPVINKPYLWRGGLYFDGGLSDPIPFKRALSSGCDRVVIILTRPKEFLRNDKTDKRLSILLKDYDNIKEALKNRAELYNEELKEAIKLEKEGKAIIIAPDSIEGMKTLKKDKKALITLYNKGYIDAEKILSFI